MKKPYYLILLILAVVFITSESCRKLPVAREVKTYSNNDNIVNPPDTFQVVYSLQSASNFIATIQFEENSVWKLERLSAPNFTILWAERTDSLNTNRFEVINRLTQTVNIGFEGGVNYDLIANRLSLQEPILFFIEFVRLTDEEYDNFSFKI